MPGDSRLVRETDMLETHSDLITECDPAQTGSRAWRGLASPRE